MPRSVQEILDQSHELAKRFEDYEPSPHDELDVEAYMGLRRAAEARADSERSVVDAVRAAREANFSWQRIGLMLGTSGEAARQRYGPKRAA